MKNKNLIIGILVVLIVLAAGGGYLMTKNSSSQKHTQQQPQQQEEKIATLQPEDIGLKLSARPDKKAVTFEINKPEGITAAEYEITYTAAGDVPRGVIGQLDITPNASVLKPKTFIDLGSCSSGKCKYDEGVKAVKLVLKVTKGDKTYQVEDTLDLEK